MMGDLPLERMTGLGAGGSPVDCGHRYTPYVVFHKLGVPKIDASPYLVSMTTHNDLATPEGSWQVVLKSRPLMTRAAVEALEWHEEVSPGDWVTLKLHDGLRLWPIMIGNVDRVHRSIGGVGGNRTVTYIISGRDHGKTLTASEIVVLPYGKPMGPANAPSAIDPAKDLPLYFRTLERLYADAKEGGISPNEILPKMLRFFLGHVPDSDNEERGTPPIWRLPKSIRVIPGAWFPGGEAELIRKTNNLPGKPMGAPMGDALHVATEPLDGALVINELCASIPNGMTLWELLASYANTEINEAFTDFLPTSFAVSRPMLASDYYELTGMPSGGAAAASAAASAAAGAGAGGSAASGVAATAASAGAAGVDGMGMSMQMVLRRRPFPSEAYLRASIKGFTVDLTAQKSGIERWRKLPWTIIDERQLVSDETSKHGEERYNLFLAVPHASYGLNPYTLVLETGHLPIVTPGSPERYGWRRRHMSSPYLPVDGWLKTYYIWSQSLADWYGHNAELLSGSLTTGRALPGIRIGERLTVRRNAGKWDETYYVEGVTHEWQRRPDGGEKTSTTLQVTRGSVLPQGGYATLVLEKQNGDLSPEENEAYDRLQREGAIK